MASMHIMTHDTSCNLLDKKNVIFKLESSSNMYL